jgi:hypothetical protein
MTSADSQPDRRCLRATLIHRAEDDAAGRPAGLADAGGGAFQDAEGALVADLGEGTGG